MRIVYLTAAVIRFVGAILTLLRLIEKKSRTVDNAVIRENEIGAGQK